MQSQAFVSFNGVQKTYDGEHLVVRDLNLDIGRGEFLTLLGPSGSGKTTSLMMLAGFETATSGEIFLDGKPIHRLPPERRDIGMVFQSYALFPHMTVAENVAFPLAARKMARSDITQRVTRALDMIGLNGFAHRRPAQLSGGQQQRVAVARALVFEPKLVLMDEPLSALDKQLREQMKFEIKRLHKELGITIVYVTHDQSEALTMSDRVAVFHDGRIAQLDTPAGLYERPTDPFVAQFIGENNRMLGEIVAVGPDECTAQCNGILIKALPVGAQRVGEKTLLSVRPERVTLSTSGVQRDNEVEARIEEIVYLGDHVRVRTSACGSDEFVIKVPNNATWQTELQEQQTIRVSWNTTDCRALSLAS